MPPPAAPARYKNHRFPGEIISHGGWLSSRFPLSYHAVQELLGARGIDVTHEALCPWGRQWGQDDAPQLKRRRAPPGAKGPLDAVCLTSHGQRHSWWRAVDQDDHVLAILVQSRRNQQAAKKFLRQWLKEGQDVPRVIIPEKLKSYGAAKRESFPGGEPRQSRSLHHRCEHSQRPTRQRARRMQGCKSAGQAQRLLSASGPMAPPCRPRRHLLSASAYRAERRNRCERWAAITGSKRVA
jgi:putative transposase